MAMHGVNTEYDSARNPVIYMSSSDDGGWNWYQVFREPDNVLCVMYGMDEYAKVLPSWIEVA